MMKTIWCVLVLAVSAGATNYTVKSDGTGNYRTIQACATAMSHGDTCTVYAGTYSENVAVPAGSAGNFNMLTVNSGDTVYVNGVTLNSYTKVNGFYIQNGANPTSTTSGACVSVNSNATQFFITNNHMYGCGGHFVNEPSGNNSTYGYIQGNTMSYSCSISSAPNTCTAMYINGDHHLIENNDISHFSDGPYLNGRWIIMRKNNEHDVNGNTDCGSNSSNCHIDFMQADSSGGTPPVEYVLLENNIVNNWVGETHAIGLFQGEACSSNCFDAIVRFHKVSHVGGGGLFNDTATWNNVKTYNNTYADINNTLSGGGEITNTFTCCSGGSDINDIFYFTVPLNGFATYGCSGTGCTGFTYGHSDAYCTAGGCNTIYSHTYGSGSFTSDPGNLEVDPQFNNYAGGDYSLKSTSPARNAGTYLTTANGSGSNSTTLTLADVTFFQDATGGMTGVQPDCISITTATNHACIVAGSINYSTNTVTLASPMTWSSGAPIYIYSISDGTVVLTDSAPDMGAFPYGTSSSSTVNPPTGLAAVVN